MEFAAKWQILTMAPLQSQITLIFWQYSGDFGLCNRYIPEISDKRVKFL
jgi:hypothetical protein